MTVAKDSFDKHLEQCSEALEIYDFLVQKGYSADFGLRFVWVASVSALDHYISELVIERSTEQFVNNLPMTPKLMNEAIPIARHFAISTSTPAQSALEFQATIASVVRFRTFQKADDVSDGLAYVWDEKHKWDKIAAALTLDSKAARRQLNSISIRRDLIVHNADYDPSSGNLTACVRDDAAAALAYIKKLVHTIDGLVV